ncbi:hypothetical protein C7379_10649 [Hallella colorans]|uniref:Uncharacterized protein n=1 Tax=Hallella colorans TaxID=1703337 RepID=A0A2U0UFS7_9BACT|nr:hypothetical protein C7379_10649 [Hallella colorans]
MTLCLVSVYAVNNTYLVRDKIAITKQLENFLLLFFKDKI